MIDPASSVRRNEALVCQELHVFDETLPRRRCLSDRDVHQEFSATEDCGRVRTNCNTIARFAIELFDVIREMFDFDTRGDARKLRSILREICGAMAIGTHVDEPLWLISSEKARCGSDNLAAMPTREALGLKVRDVVPLLHTLDAV